MIHQHRSHIYGVVGEFETEHQLLHAAEKTREAGYRRMDAYAPFPVEGLSEAMGLKSNKVAMLTLIGGLCGGLGGFGFEYWCNVISYPLNIGGRPLNSWPAFIPVTFELTILVAALSAVLGMLALNGLPMPYHPLFNNPRFALASRNRFFLCIESRDPKFDLDHTRYFLESLNPREVSTVAD